ncbi:hypothetical protein [Blastococcus brunescens]|uniref:AAA+ ATPase domain-containing protein n=1 Tax=Blastococcus brunescens TaxID=1564165 RepID=A0ABZ1AZ68_9ACTN|nr:hypothetical protein [Blastococcus sp. BMG 8361]WRL63868.1 hypothetical protein U6N30_30340 [Blastococcus sp. BMG 8361]
MSEARTLARIPVRATESPPTWAGSSRALARRVVDEHDGGDGATHVAVRGVGGTGKTALLAELARSYRAAGITVVDAQGAPEPGDVTHPLAVLVDDAQRLTLRTTGRLRALLQQPRVRLVLAYRPWPRPPALLDLVEAMAGDRHLVVLNHLDRDAVRDCAEHRFGPLAPELIDLVVHQTGGLPALVEPMLRALAATRPQRVGGAPAHRATGTPSALTQAPAPVTERVLADLAELDECTRWALHALAAGAPLDADVLADLVSVPSDEAVDLVQRAQATGAVLPSGKIVPVVRATLLSSTPADATRAVRRRLFVLSLDRGEEPIELARTLATDRVRDPRVAQLLVAHADAAVTGDPALAGELLSEAADAGAPPASLALRRALAAALAGDLDGALQWADATLRDSSAPDHQQAAGVTAAVLAQRGLLHNTAQLYRVAGPDRAGSAALALLALGARDEAETELAAAEEAARGWCPTSCPAASHSWPRESWSRSGRGRARRRQRRPRSPP